MHKCGYAAEKGKAKQEKGKEKRGPAENQGGGGVWSRFGGVSVICAATAIFTCQPKKKYIYVGMIAT